MTNSLKLKRVLCITAFFTYITVIFTYVGINAFADGLLFDMEALGITNGIENIQEQLKENVSRDSFCHMVVNMMGYNSLSKNLEYKDTFEDIGNSPYKQSIQLMYSLNFISGDDTRTFSPGRAITPMEAAKVLVDALGYAPVVKERSLNEYYAVAFSLGIMRDVETDGNTIDFQNVLIMINNALDKDKMVYVYESGESYKIEPGNTYRNALFSMQGNNIVKARGVVTADVSTYLNTKITSLNKNQLEINGKVYTFENAAPLGYVGQMVEFYVKTDSNGNEVVFSITPSPKNKVVIFSKDNFISASQGKIELENEKMVTDPKAKYIYNNRLKQNFKIEDFNSLKDFNVSAVDCNGDDMFETFFIEAYKDFIIDRAYGPDKIVYFKGSESLNGMKYVVLDMDDKDLFITLTDTDGNPITFDKLAEDMLLSIAASEDGEALKVYVSDKKSEGIFSEFSDDYITVGVNKFKHKLSGSIPTLGSNVRVYIRFDGKAVFIDTIKDSLNYAYVYAMKPQAGVSRSYQAKLLIPGPVEVKYNETEDADGGEKQKTPKLYCRNSDVIVLDISTNVRVDGRRIDFDKLPKAILNKPVSYTVNSEGEINCFKTLLSVDSIESKYYNANELTFGKTGNKAFGISQGGTRAICIPTNTISSDEDLKVFVELLNGVRYNVAGYALDESTNLVDMLVMSAEMRSGVFGNINSSSDIGIVEKVSISISENDNDRIINVVIINEGERKKYSVSRFINSQEAFVNLRRGDLIAFSLDGFDNLNGCEILQKADAYYDYISGEYTDNEKFCGIVENIKYNQISNIKNRWVNNLEVKFSNESSIKRKYEIFSRGNIPVFIIQENGSTFAGKFDDIKPGDRVFVATNLDVPRVVVIDRRN